MGGCPELIEKHDLCFCMWVGVNEEEEKGGGGSFVE